MTKVKVGDLVRLRRSTRTFAIVEIDVPGQTPKAPSTTVVRIAPYPELKPDFYLYGDAVLEPAT